LIEIYADSKSDVVFDPFCGSGTALVEGMKQGHPSIGVDLHPLACLISRVKTRPLPDNFGSRAREIVTTVRNRFPSDVEPPDLPNIDHWFKKPIQQALTLIINELEEVENTHTKEALQVALSSIIVNVSNQDSNTRYAAVENDVTAEDVLQKFSRAVSKIESAFLKDTEWRKNEATCDVINKNILEVEPSDIPRKVDLVVTSPPYPNAYEYWLYHKYRMYWLGLADPTEVREHEIGARPHYQGSNPRDESDFEERMESLFDLLREITTENATASFIVGRSVIQGEEVDNGELLERAADSSGFYTADSAARSIPSNTKSFNPGYSKIKDEKILTFKKR
jgi:site-specific DNA-methyltransferase (cytosine-N4-specific)